MMGCPACIADAIQPGALEHSFDCPARGQRTGRRAETEPVEDTGRRRVGEVIES